MGSALSIKRHRTDYRKSRVNVSSFTFTWEIENFSHCPQQTGEALESDTFSADDSTDKWCLKIYVRGDRKENKDYVALYLKLVESDQKHVGARFACMLKKDEGKSYKRDSLVQHGFKGQPGKGWSKFIERSYLLDPTNGLLPNDKLTIVCFITIAGDTVSVASEMRVAGLRGLGQDIPKPQTSDKYGKCVTLRVGGKQLGAHKAILTANSPVFSAMFKHKTKESRTGKIDIEDTEPKVMREMLHFFYTGSAPNLKSMADRLLVLADKYQVEPLKLVCEDAMAEQLSVKNSCEILVEADRLSATRLKSHAIQFMIAQATAVFKSKGFKSFSEQYPQLQIETLQTMAALQFPTK